MVKKMNKSGFIQELKNKTKLTNENCIIVNDILEDNFIIGKNNKESLINMIKEKLYISETEAENIYEIAINIIVEEINNKIKHPFKSKD